MNLSVMKSSNDVSSCSRQDSINSNLSTFRKRNRILIIISIFFMISLTLIILGALIAYPPRAVNSAVNAFCEVAESTPSCFRAILTVLNSRTNNNVHPNQIFTLSLRTADDKIVNLITFLSNNATSAFKNCSVSLRVGLGRIRAALRAHAFLGSGQRAAMLKKVAGAEESLDSCIDEMGRVGKSSTAAMVQEVKVYVSSSRRFLLEYARVLLMCQFYRISMVNDIVYHGGVLFGLQILFIFGLFWSLFTLRR